jgi:hypothetical protein
MAALNERIKMFPKLNRFKVIAGVGLLSGMLLLITGLSSRMYFYSYDESSVYRTISSIVAIGWAMLCLISAFLLLREKAIGYIILLIAGIGGIVGTFIPIFAFDPGYGIQIVYLSTSMTYYEYVLPLIGGLYGVAIGTKPETSSSSSKDEVARYYELKAREDTKE